MNLVSGEILDIHACDAVLEELETRINKTLSKGTLKTETVINACDKLVSTLDSEQYLSVMEQLGISKTLGTQYLEEAKRLFCRESLICRLKKELGEPYDSAYTYTPKNRSFSVTERYAPLGVLLHIAAGNADGLPAFSVLEGLLTGNINILKLPAAEGGVSVRILRELIAIEPILADYIYVFEYSSKDITHIEKLIQVTDAVIVWGGETAVSAIRKLVPPHIRLIEWGHKISFGYVTPQGFSQEGVAGLAHNIAVTGQLLCSSVQGVFIDTDDMEEVYKFCALFLPILEEAVRSHSPHTNIGIRAQTALQLYNAELEGIYHPRRIFKGDACSLIAYPDHRLETAIQFGNAWARPLPRQKLLETLRPYKNFLQTVGLLSGENERVELTELLLKTGAVRVCSGKAMSDAYSGMPHDGEYPLRRYCKIVSVEQPDAFKNEDISQNP